MGGEIAPLTCAPPAITATPLRGDDLFDHGRTYAQSVGGRPLGEHSGLKSDIARGPKSANGRHSAFHFDHLVGAGEHLGGQSICVSREVFATDKA